MFFIAAFVLAGVSILLFLERVTLSFQVQVNAFHILLVIPLIILVLFFWIIGILKKMRGAVCIVLSIAIFVFSMPLLIVTFAADLTEQVRNDTTKVTADGQYEYHFEMVRSSWILPSRSRLWLRNIQTGEEQRIPIEIDAHEVVLLSIPHAQDFDWALLEPTLVENIYRLEVLGGADAIRVAESFTFLIDMGVQEAVLERRTQRNRGGNAEDQDYVFNFHLYISNVHEEERWAELRVFNVDTRKEVLIKLPINPEEIIRGRDFGGETGLGIYFGVEPTEVPREFLIEIGDNFLVGSRSFIVNVETEEVKEVFLVQ